MKLQEFLDACAAIPKDPVTGCQLWRGSAKQQQIWLHETNKLELVNRLVLTAKLGRPIKPGFLSCHDCDRTGCVNTDHIYEGTYFDNNRDTVIRGRRKKDINTANHARGEKHYLATISKADADQIKKLYIRGETRQIDLAKQFNTDQSTVSLIILGKHWSQSGEVNSGV